MTQPLSSFSQHSRIRRLGMAAAMSLLALTGNAQADTFGVHVVDARGEPMPGVAVCVGMQGNYKQFGTLFTDSTGTAILDVPNVPLVVTVSKDRFTGTRVREPARGYGLIKQIRLFEGVPGPRCRAGSSLAGEPGIPGMFVREIDISGSATARLLQPSVSGNPSHYRISASRDFFGAEWQRYSPAITLSEALSGERELFMQLRQRQGNDSAWIEALSTVITIVMPRS